VAVCSISCCVDVLSLVVCYFFFFFFFSSRRRHTRSYGDWSSDVCSSDLGPHFRRHLIFPGSAGIPAGELLLPENRAQHWPDSNRSEERRVGKECRSRWARYH